MPFQSSEDVAFAIDGIIVKSLAIAVPRGLTAECFDPKGVLESLVDRALDSS